MKLALLFAAAVGVALVLWSWRARAQGVEAFMAGNAKTAAELTDEKVERFLVFWKVRAEFSSAATPSVLRGLKDGGYDGVVAAAQQNAGVFKSAEEAAAAKSGLSEREGLALFMLLATHYQSIYAATNSHNDAWLATTRAAFARRHGQAALDIVTRHEREALALVAQRNEALKAQMQNVGP